MVKVVSDLKRYVHSAFIMEWQPLAVDMAIANLRVR
jgi:hypothetical protein